MKITGIKGVTKIIDAEFGDSLEVELKALMTDDEFNKLVKAMYKGEGIKLGEI